MAFQRIGARQAGIAAQFNRLFHHLYRSVGDEVLDAESIRWRHRAIGGRVEQHAVGEQQRVQLPQRLLKARQAG